MAASVYPIHQPRPVLRCLDGGRAPVRLSLAAARRRRRWVVATLAAVALVAALALANAAVASTAGGGHHLPATGSPSAPATYVAQPGDTWWSIAGATAPGTDVRIAVDRLVERNGRTLVAGQVVELP